MARSAYVYFVVVIVIHFLCGLDDAVSTVDANFGSGHEAGRVASEVDDGTLMMTMSDGNDA